MWIKVETLHAVSGDAKWCDQREKKSPSVIPPLARSLRFPSSVLRLSRLALASDRVLLQHL